MNVILDDDLQAELNVGPQHLDEVKGQLQEPLHRLRALRSEEFCSAKLQNDISALSCQLEALPKNGGARDVSMEDVDEIMRRLSLELDLATFDCNVDRTAATSMAESSPAALQHQMLMNYLGFSFWDVWTLPMSEWHELEEHREIRVDRISPVDATSLRLQNMGRRLKGAELGHFAGFLSRFVRESDYLWGRLHGAERLIDIVCNAAAAENSLNGIDIKKIKKSAFQSILDTEDRCLVDKKLLATVRELVDRL